MYTMQAARLEPLQKFATMCCKNGYLSARVSTHEYLFRAQNAADALVIT